MFQPNFVISANLLQYIASIEASREIIKNSPIVPAWEAKFQEDARVRTVYHGTRLEGNELSAEQAQRVLAASGTDPDTIATQTGIVGKARDVQEVINYRAVLDWINDWGRRYQADQSGAVATATILGSTSAAATTTANNSSAANTTPIYTLDMLRTLHSISMHRVIAPDQCGALRTQRVIVRGVDSGEVVHRPPDPEDIPHRLQDFLTWLNSPAARQVHTVFRAAITHYELVNVHPFVDGNGRTARAYALALMYAENYDVKRFFSLEQYFDNDIENYYVAIRSVQQHPQQDMTYWMEYFAYGLAIELDRIKQQVLKLSKDLHMHKKLGQQVALSERQLIIMEYLQEQGRVTSADLNRILPMISTDTVLRDLKELIDKGLIRKHGVTKGVHYTLVD